MTNSEFIQLLANSVRDPSKRNYGAATLASAADVAKMKLIALVGKDNLPPLVSFDTKTINEVYGGRYGYFTVPSNFDEEIYIDYTGNNSDRPTPFKIVDISELGDYQFKYSEGGDQYSLVAARESQGNIYLTLGVTSGTVLLYYKRKPAAIADNGTALDIPDRYIPNLIEIAQSILLDWGEKYEASEVKMRRQIQELKTQKQEKDTDTE